MSVDSGSQPSEGTPRRTQASRGDGAAWAGGAVLILLGVAFLLQNTGAFRLDNWWALFILIGAVSSFGAAWNAYRRNGNQVSTTVTGPLIGGLVLTAITAAFLFSLDWGLIWPLLLILAGVGALLGGLARRR